MHDSPSNGKPLSGCPVVFGEILFDHFPDGRSVLGGAPFNVAWHLAGFGHEPLMVSRVGRDEAGDRIRARMLDWGLSTDGLEVDDLLPTGRVTVEIEHDEPTYRIEPHQAYDRIDGSAARASGRLANAALLYHGSLAVRDPAARATLDALREACAAPTFVDINLRAPWWRLDDARTLVHGAAWVKLNAEELATLAGGDAASEAACVETAAALAGAQRIDCVVVTRGADGALVWRSPPGGVLARGAAFPVAEIADTVGAGDAFAAVTLVGILEGWAPEPTLARALRFAADICGHRGATPDTREFYAAHRRTWEGRHD